jgi:ribokinase
MTVVVAGSINMDLVVRALRHPCPGETVVGEDLRCLPGGKGANQAIAAAKAGVPTALIGCLGKDNFGDVLTEFLAESGVDIQGVRRVETATGTALIVVDAKGENTIVITAGANGQVSPQDVETITTSEKAVFLSQLEIPQQTVQAFFARGRALGATTMLNAAPAVACSQTLLELVDILVVNESELAALLNREILSIPEAALVLRSHEDQKVVVTLGAAGAMAIHKDEIIEIPGRSVNVVDTIGAGDCFTGSLAARLALGYDLPLALHWANAAASLCVQRCGAAPSLPTAEEVEAIL